MLGVASLQINWAIVFQVYVTEAPWNVSKHEDRVAWILLDENN